MAGFLTNSELIIHRPDAQVLHAALELAELGWGAKPGNTGILIAEIRMHCGADDWEWAPVLRWQLGAGRDGQGESDLMLHGFRFDGDELLVGGSSVTAAHNLQVRLRRTTRYRLRTLGQQLVAHLATTAHSPDLRLAGAVLADTLRLWEAA